MLPVARVCVEVPLPHLDRLFDYRIAADDDEAAQPGVRVKVRFAGQLVNGYLLERVESSAHARLAWLDKVVSPERVLDPEIARLARAVADRYAGNLSDVLRLAVPPRHARVEAKPPSPATQPTGADAAQLVAPAAEPVAAHPVAPVAAQSSDAVARPAASVRAQRSDAVAVQPSDAAQPVSPSAEPVAAQSVASSAEPVAAHSVAARPTAAHSVAARSTAAQPVVAVRAQHSGAGAAQSSASSADPAAAQLSDDAAQPSDAAAQPFASSAELVASQPAARLAAADGAVGLPAARVAAADGAVGRPAVSVVAGSDAAGVAAPVVAGGWGEYPAGAAFLQALEQGRAARAVWSALPGEDWAARIAEAAAATVRAGRGVVVVVADARDLQRLDRALERALGAGRHVALNAAAGPAERYRRFLAAGRHQVPVVVGTRAAMFAPVAELGLVVIWDDGDDLHAEPRAPYPHAREVLLTRAQLSGCAALVAGFARTGEAQLLLETGWAKEIVATRETLRVRCPAIAPTGDDPQLARDPGAVTARLPSLAWQAARQALQAGSPVLVQVPRRGYLPSVACAECRTPARCPHCSGPLGLAGARDVPTCHWCARVAADYSCPACGGRRLRASVTGARRTAEELGRAFPGVPVRTSGRDEVLDTVPGDAAVVVSTPGAEPVAEGGYGAVLLLDTWALLTRADLRAAEETMRRWLSAAALAKPGRGGGRVVVVADGSLAPVQALLRWDPGWFAARELAERRELGFPPAVRFVSLTGQAEAVNELLDAARLPDGAEVLGPVPAADEQERMLVRINRGRAAELAHALHEAAGVRSAKKATLPVRVQVDPAELL
ncbi:primosomal protein N' [Symbioplanes lichenis]|uniref:primosomal protein N' family DNA-binding protein n=1 Tax=Symbioplanes lichenis TaxID=1629072 RepID=UPI002738EEDB|nr:primosomal protein N' [Actinoplanes lichenis]